MLCCATPCSSVHLDVIRRHANRVVMMRKAQALLVAAGGGSKGKPATWNLRNMELCGCFPLYYTPLSPSLMGLLGHSLVGRGWATLREAEPDASMGRAGIARTPWPARRRPFQVFAGSLCSRYYRDGGSDEGSCRGGRRCQQQSQDKSLPPMELDGPCLACLAGNREVAAASFSLPLRPSVRRFPALPFVSCRPDDDSVFVVCVFHF